MKPFHPKEMPVILRSINEVITWLYADWNEAKEFLRRSATVSWFFTLDELRAG